MTTFYTGPLGTAVQDSTLNTNLNALSAAGYATSSIIATGTISSPGMIWVELVLASAIALGSTDYFIPVFLVPVPDGTNAPSFPGTTSGSAWPAQLQVGSIPLTASGSFTRGVVAAPIDVPSSAFLLGVQAPSVAFPTTGNVVNLYPFNDMA